MRTRAGAQAAINAVTKPDTSPPVRALIGELAAVGTIAGASGATGAAIAGPSGPLTGRTAAVLMALGSLQPSMAAVLAGGLRAARFAVLRAAVEQMLSGCVFLVCSKRYLPWPRSSGGAFCLRAPGVGGGPARSTATLRRSSVFRPVLALRTFRSPCD
jgi:hypothetical protein